jgi:hypothetical protein
MRQRGIAEKTDQPVELISRNARFIASLEDVSGCDEPIKSTRRDVSGCDFLAAVETGFYFGTVP